MNFPSCNVLLEMINPLVSTRFWTVDAMNFWGGQFKSFWIKSSALKYANKMKVKYPLVTLTNELTRSQTELYNTWDETYKDLVIYRALQSRNHENSR